jgi:hypothetical protein
MTQCILSHILSDGHQISRNRLEIFYNDCLNKDEQLDELAAIQEDNIYRRQLQLFDENKSKIENFIFFFLFLHLCFLDFYYQDPFIPVAKSDNKLIISLENSYGVPLLMEYDRPDEIDVELSRISPMAVALAQAVAEEQELQQANNLNNYFIDSDELILEEPSMKIVAEESAMSNNNRFYLIKYVLCSLKFLFQKNQKKYLYI